MQKFLVVIALILLLSNENLAWKNWNPKSYLKTRNTNEHCLLENEIAMGLLNYIDDTYKHPMNLTMEFVSSCENSEHPIECFGIWTAFGLRVTKLILDNDLQPLVDFENEICDKFETVFDCSDCLQSVINFPYHLFNPVRKLLSNFELDPDHRDLWIESFHSLLKKHSEGMCSYHGYRKMVEARSGLPEKGLTLTLKKGVLEWKFWKTCFSLKLTI